MTQLNTPYPATAYLTGFLRPRGVETHQVDVALELILKLFSQEGLTRIRAELLAKMSKNAKSRSKVELPKSVDFFLQNFDAYLETIEPAVRFLQGKDPSLSLRIVSRNFLPEGPQFLALRQFEELELEGTEADPLAWAFGNLGTHDRAKYLASLLINDIASVIKDGVDERFELSRYGEKLAASSPSFEPLHRDLHAAPSLVDLMLDDVTREVVEKFKPDVIGLTAPFPGNVYGAFRIAMVARRIDPSVKTILGGGFVNTELRSLTEPRVFDYFDYVVLDDGYRPLQNILDSINGNGGHEKLLRTFVREDGKVVLRSNLMQHDIPQKDVGAPIYHGLSFDRYLSIFEMLNPMHRLWSDGRWNKLTVAHGCYWKKCAFCDIGLDYIGRYEPNTADTLVGRIRQVMNETGQSGFHFVDEAAPPAGLRSLAEELLDTKTVISWWGNVRFEKTFTSELCQLLARSGCVAISGGLEVASDRLLKLMQKGVTVEQVARVTRAFADAGIMVHAYLMYGFPTQTEQETIDSLERVRQLFVAGCIQSAFWHRFAATAHSPIGIDPKAYGITLDKEPEVSFGRNDLNFTDPSGVDHDALGLGLRKSLYNYMHGIGLEKDVRHWFEHKKMPATKVDPQLIENALEEMYESEEEETIYEEV
ncbi:MAG: radical SAM protein [Bdellovibrionota bacterium]